MKKFLSTGVIVLTAVATFTPIVHTLSAGAAGTNTTVVLDLRRRPRRIR